MMSVQEIVCLTNQIGRKTCCDKVVFTLQKMQSNRSAVIDLGSSTTKAGLSGSSSPVVHIPTVVGHLKQPNGLLPENYENECVGDAAVARRGILNLNHPVQEGRVTDWKDVERLLLFVFLYELRIRSEEQPLLMSEAMGWQLEDAEKMVELVFEKLRVPSYHTVKQPVLSLMASDCTTGLSFDSGLTTSRAVPVVDGNVINEAVKSIPVGGKQLDDYMISMLGEKGILLSTQREKALATEIKENLGRASLNFETEKFKEQSFELPDGSELIISNERFRCVEAIFQPQLVGLDCASIHEVIHASIQQCDMNIRMELYKNIALSGGNTMFESLDQRLFNELSTVAPSPAHIKIFAPPQRIHSTWLGGSILSSMSIFPSLCMTQEDYAEQGLAIIRNEY